MERLKALIAVIFFIAALIFSKTGIEPESILNVRSGNRDDANRQNADTLIKTQYNYQPEKQYPDFYIK